MNKVPVRQFRFDLISLGRSTLFGFIFVIALWIASIYVVGMAPAAFGAVVLIFALPAAVGMWHQSTVRHLVRLHQFARGSGLRWLASRRLLAMLALALLALFLMTTVLLQCVFFGPLEWAMLSVSPFIYAVLRAGLSRLITRQFSQPVYELRGVFWITQGLFTVFLTGCWLFVRMETVQPSLAPIAEAVFIQQHRWSAAPSGIIRWGLDASSWIHAGVDMLSRSVTPNWRLIVSLFATPLAVFSFLSLTLSGFSLPRAELQRTLADPLSEAESPPRIGPVRAAVLSALAAICIMFYFQAIAIAERQIRYQNSPFAVERFPECERIGEATYKLNTIKAVEAFMTEMLKSFNNQQDVACQNLDDIEAHAGKAVDAYLDWYFSLGAEWARTLGLLAGGADALLKSQFEKLVLSDPAVSSRLAAIENHFEQLSALTSAGRFAAAQVLENHRLVLTDRQCIVVRELPADPATPAFNRLRGRLVAGSASGLLAGAVSAKITSKAMAKLSMKAASKILLKAAAKKSASKAGAAAAGAVIGTAVAPGVGTAVGAVIGAGVGLAIGVGVDLVTLSAEEKLTRADMKQDLLKAVAEAMQSYRTAFACRH